MWLLPVASALWACSASDGVVRSPADVRALRGVVRIEGDLVVQGTALEELDLPDLEVVEGHIHLWENDPLTAVTWPRLREIGGDLSLFDNPELRSLSGWTALEEVGGTLRINHMPALPDLQGLNGLRTVGGLYFFRSPSLQGVGGLEQLESVAQGVQFLEMAGLSEVVFPSLRAVGSKLEVFNSDALTTLSAPLLQELRSFELHHCDRMVDAGSFPQVTALEGSFGSSTTTGSGGWAALPGCRRWARPRFASTGRSPRWQSWRSRG